MLEGGILLFSSPFFLVNLWIILLAQNSFPITVGVSFPYVLRFVFDITEAQECPKLILIRFILSYNSACVLLHPTLKVQ